MRCAARRVAVSGVAVRCCALRFFRCAAAFCRYRKMADDDDDVLTLLIATHCVLIAILIDPTVWPQYTVTDRTGQDGQTDRQRSDSIGRNVSQTVAQKATEPCF